MLSEAVENKRLTVKCAGTEHLYRVFFGLYMKFILTK